VNVVLISRDHRLGAILTMALPTPEDLTLLDSASEVPDASEAPIDAVVLDLPADTRRDAYVELRQRYEGRVVVPVDSARDTNGWPPDARRRFLVRPFQVADLIAGVQEPAETSVAERAARYRRLFRWNRQQAPAFPDLSTPPAAEPAPVAEAEAGRFDEPFEAEAGADLHNNHVEDHESPVVEYAEDEEALGDEDDEELAAEAEEVAAEAEDEDEEDAPAAEGHDDDEDASVAADVEAAAAEEAHEAEDEVEDWEPSQEDEDLAAAFLAQAEEPLPADDKGLAAATADPSTQERAAGLAPPLQVQAGVAMAKAVALQQWLEAEEAKRTRGRRRRLLLNVAAGLVLLLAGIGIGMAIGPDEPQQVSPPATPQPVVQIRDAPPAACTQAMDDADAVISYLVAKIRDERLSKSIQDYGANARACRRTGRSP
jgi:hypothetical protein